MAAQITLYSSADFESAKRLDSVVEITFHREWWRDDGKCTFTGLAVPFVRDWEEVVDNIYSKSVISPKPSKIAGRAYVINRKLCPGKAPEPMFLVDETVNWNVPLLLGYKIFALNVTAMRDDQRPKWLPQVLARIERVAETDPKAKCFMDFMQDSIRLHESAPDQ